jgi:pilus assembly protein CpaE
MDVKRVSADKNENTVMSTYVRDAESFSMAALSFILIGPDEKRRRAVAKAFVGPQVQISREFASYPAMDDLAELLAAGFDGVVIDLDANAEQALDVIENLCASNSSITVMVYSAQPDSELLVRCMRAGAREFLTEPVSPASAGEALVRAAARREEVRRQRTPAGKLVVFVGPKGGCGVTTLAANFAVSLAKHAKVALLDLDLHLGDVALTLGLTTSFTALDAFENMNRLDADFLAGLMAKHASGLSVLSAPDQIPQVQPSGNGLDRLLRVAREGYEYVVVDAGSWSIDTYQTLFEAATAVYLVTQVTVADLRSANRFVRRFFSGADAEKLEIILNRYDPRNLEIDDAAVSKALLRPARWRIPSDFPAAQRAQNSGLPVVLEKSAMARAITDMAMAACGQAAFAEKKKKKFSLFG